MYTVRLHVGVCVQYVHSKTVSSVQCVGYSLFLPGRSTESLEHSDNDSAEALKAGSRSPSASPQVITTYMCHY